MRIARLDRERVSAALDLWCTNWVETGDSAPTGEDRERLRRVLEGYVSHPQTCCFVAEQEHGIVGFVTASLSAHPVMAGLAGTIEELYVLPAFRRQSIGSQLVQAASSFLRDQGAGVLRAHFCSDSEVGRALWMSLGWEPDLATFSLYDVGGTS